MIVKDNWFRTNVCDIQEFSNENLIKFRILPYEFDTSISFLEASDKACEDIKKIDKKIYLALSGGADSYFVAKCFIKNNVDFTPLIVKVENANIYELQYALEICSEGNVKPVVIHKTEDEMIELYKQYIHPLNGDGFYCTSQIVCNKYINEHEDGILVTGVNIIGGTNGEGLAYAGVYEFDFYGDIFFGPNRELPFHLYSAEIVYTTIRHIYTKQNEDDFKCSLYDITWRAKSSYKYKERSINTLTNLKKERGISKKKYLILEEPDSFLEKIVDFGVENEIQSKLQIPLLRRRRT